MLTDMSQPLGYTVGNALEVREAIETLRPDLPSHPRFETLVFALAGQAFVLCGLEPDAERGQSRAQRLLRSGDALEKFRQMVEAQGGDPRVVDDLSLLPCAPLVAEWCAPASGYVAEVAPRTVALAALQLGAGRQKKEDAIDPAVGVEVLKCVGDPVQQDEPVFRIHARTEASLQQAMATLQGALRIRETPIPPLSVLLD
jgi:thymidine phosphorylase